MRISALVLLVLLLAQRSTFSVKAATTDVQVKHVYVLVLENHSFSSIIGNKNMPWLNALAINNA